MQSASFTVRRFHRVVSCRSRRTRQPSVRYYNIIYCTRTRCVVSGPRTASDFFFVLETTAPFCFSAYTKSINACLSALYSIRYYAPTVWYFIIILLYSAGSDMFFLSTIPRSHRNFGAGNFRPKRMDATPLQVITMGIRKYCSMGERGVIAKGI